MEEEETSEREVKNIKKMENAEEGEENGIRKAKGGERRRKEDE